MLEWAPSLGVTFDLLRWRTQVEWRLEAVSVVEVDLLHPRRKWVVVGVWWNVINIVCLLVSTRLCCTIDIVCGLPVVGQNFLEILEEQDGAVVVCSGPSPV